MARSFAQRMAKMQPSTIREILKVTNQPEMISFAGGLPAPELFPVAEIGTACQRVLEHKGAEALQYGATEGYYPLREYLVSAMAQRGVTCEVEEILITNGSQQLLDLVGKIMLDPGDVVLVESPTYLAAIQAFQSYEARFVTVPTDELGIIPDQLPELIEHHRPKFLYTIPTFQNPSGITMSAERRQALYQIAEDYDLLVVEDDPYGRLRYRGSDLLSIKALDTADRVIYLSTFSKTIAPGLRLGWAVTSPEILSKLVIAKQAADLHSSGLDQRVVYEYVTSNNTEAHIQRIRTAYGERFRVMNEALQAEMPEGFHWTQPEGGMFLWVTGPNCLETGPLLQAAIQQMVVFVPGQDFYPNGGGCQSMRLNFSNSTPERIREGIHRLAELCRQSLVAV